MNTRGREWIVTLGVLAAASTIAVASPLSWANWNDGSRLATVESLVDRHTFAIDDSIFVLGTGAPEGEGAVRYPTKDRILVDGRFYSDKPPVPALFMAGLYQLWRWSGGAAARDRPDRFCYWMALGSSGLAYVVAVVSVFLLGRPLGLPLATRLILAASFALATVALPYARQVNAHVVLLAVAALIFLRLAFLARDGWACGMPLVFLGALAGFGYTVDLGAGPPLLAAVLVLVAYRCRRPRAVLEFVLGALPWLVLHHALNYSIGGTLRPVSSVPAYLSWPGSPFDRTNMTGVWHWDGMRASGVYALALLFGERGFLLHNPPLWLALAGGAVIWQRRPRETPELVCGAAWCAATWAVYSLGSNNYSGSCVSVRWFVPFLAPGYLALAVLMRERPDLRAALVAMSCLGAVLAAAMWVHGPWYAEWWRGWEVWVDPSLWPGLAVLALASLWILYESWCPER